METVSPNPNRTRAVAPSTDRIQRVGAGSTGVGGGWREDGTELRGPGRVLDELDPDLVRVQDEGDPVGSSGQGVRLLRHPDPPAPGPLEEGVEVRHLEGEMIQLLA